jgi:hypothetical protein
VLAVPCAAGATRRRPGGARGSGCDRGRGGRLGLILEGPHPNRFALEIVGYEFPDLEDDRFGWDSNWLRIRIEVTTERGSWTSIDPSLLTTDVALLADWLDAAETGREADRLCWFVEPSLSFELVERGPQGALLRVWFELESRPPWARKDFVSTPDCAVDLTVGTAELGRAAAALREQLRRFPPREPLPA